MKHSLPAPINLPPRFNIAHHLLHRHVDEGRGERRALICPDRDWSYRELAELASRFAVGIRSLGVRPGQRVMLLIPDTAEMVASYLGTMLSGAVAVPTNTVLRADDYAYFLDESEAPLLVTHSALWHRLEGALEGRPHLRHIIACGDECAGARRWSDWIADSTETTFEPSATKPDDAAFWLWTSGSTGSPKAAVHRHQDWVYCAEFYARGILKMQASDRCFSSSKLFHAYGLGNSLAFPLHVGAESVLEPGRPTPEAILGRATEARPTLLFCVPTLYGALLQHVERGGDCDLGSVRLAVSAAEPLPGTIYRAWRERFGCEILDGIGSTEVLHIYASSVPGRSRPDTTGFPVPGYEIRITDENGGIVEVGEVGDLWVKGPSTASHYWNREALSQERMQGEWFFTGDKYWADDQGYLHYAGRSDDMFRVSGQWVSPIEVEAALIEHPAVLECAVVPSENDAGLVKPKAFVVLSSGAPDPTLASELQEWVKAKLTPYKYPRDVVFTGHLPKTASGKIQRFKLR